MVVMKFGGSSVANAKNIAEVVTIIQEKKEARVVVFSAMAGVTDSLENVWKNYQEKSVIDAECYLIKQVFFTLIEALISSNSSLLISKALVESTIEELIKQERKRTLSHTKLLSVGEKLTTFIIQQYCQELNINAELIDAEKLIRLNEEKDVDTEYIAQSCAKLLNNRSQSKVYITQGFVCSDVNGKTSVLGRGGSDYSATLIGSALNARFVEIWSDTNGVLNTDPRKVDKTFTLNEISYDEATEMAFFGAKILHPKCLIPAKKADVKVLVKNTFNKKDKGTTISWKTDKTTIVKAAAVKENITILTITSSRQFNEHEFICQVFNTLKQQQINLISVTEATIAVAILANENTNTCVSNLSAFGNVSVSTQKSIITLVGNLSCNKNGNSGTILKPFKTIPIKMISYGASNNSISIVIDEAYQNLALQNINEQVFNLKNYKNV